MMEIIKNYNGKELTLSVNGRIDTITSVKFDESIQDEYGNFNSLIIDFNDVNYISSAGLRVLISTGKKLEAEDIKMVILNVSDDIQKIFKLSGFDKIFEIQ